MLTFRSSCLLILATAAMFLGLLNRNEGVAFTGLVLLIWLGIQWFSVRWALRSRDSLIGSIQRTIDGESHDYFTLAVDQNYRVQLRGKFAGRLILGHRVSIRDTLPPACKLGSGSSELVMDRSGESGFQLNYQIQPTVCGKVEISGLVVSVEDSNGFFRGQRFIALPQKLTILPFLIRPQTTNSVLKNNNLQRIQGHHRHKSAGISAELLGIRDYRPGDPPRSIAWKPTARLGKLMSREFETEVPIRSTLICDLSPCQFINRPEKAAADRVISGAASITRLLLADRDPVAAVILTGATQHRVQHGGGERQLAKILHHFLIASDPGPRLEHMPENRLLRIVFRECFRRFPDCFDRRTSFVPVPRTIFKPFRSKSVRMKCRLAPVLCGLLDRPPGFEFRLIHDIDELRLACLEYVRKYPVVSSPVIDVNYDWTFRYRDYMNRTICKSLLTAKNRAKDNELFVVVGCLPVDADQAVELVNALRVCRAAGHRVVFLDCVDPPPESDLVSSTTYQNNIRDLVALGVRFASHTDPRLIEKVATETDILRSGNSGRGVSSRSARASAVNPVSTGGTYP